MRLSGYAVMTGSLFLSQAGIYCGGREYYIGHKMIRKYEGGADMLLGIIVLQKSSYSR